MPEDSKIDEIARYFEVEKSELLRLMGRLDNDKGYSPQVAAATQELDKVLQGIEDPEIREILNSEYAHALWRIKDLGEKLNDLRKHPREAQ